MGQQDGRRDDGRARADLDGGELSGYGLLGRAEEDQPGGSDGNIAA